MPQQKLGVTVKGLGVFKHLYVWVIIGIVAGVFVGWLWPEFGVSLKPLGVGFVNLIKMIIAPVIFCTVASGIAKMSDVKAFGRVGGKALAYFISVSSLALLVGLAVALVVRPGDGFNVDPATLDPTMVAEYVGKAHDMKMTDFFMGIIPSSFIGAFTSGNLLQVLFIAILTGFACTRLGEFGDKAAHALEDIVKIFFGIINILVKAAPVGAFGAMAFTIGEYGLKSLGNLAALVGVFYLTAFLFIVIVLGVICRLTGFSLFRFLNYIREEILIVIGASSSEAALPQLMNKLERLGAAKPVVGLVMPTGYSFNLDGTNIYMTLATLFLAQATNTPLTPGEIATLLGVAIITSKGAAGVTGSGFITLAATLSVINGLPVAALALVIGIDRFMSECRAITNFIGNGVATLVVAKWEKSLDMETLHRELKSGPKPLAALTPAADETGPD